MTRIEVGKDFDGAISIVPKSTLGHLVCGPSRLLSWLESQLGLESPEVSFTSRMVLYLSCIKELDGPERFYHESLKQDEFGVARTLMQWRDTWFEAGWQGDVVGADNTPRLVDMQDIEKLALNRVPVCLGQRVQRVLTELEQQQLDVTLSLRDPVAVFPKVWRELFERLSAAQDDHRLEPSCDDDSDLAKLQRHLVTPQDPSEKITLSGDGTVVFLKDGSPQLSATWIARFANEQSEVDASVAILATDHGATLDDALNDAGYPRLGFSDTSIWRPVFQVLPLSLELLWRPLDPGVLLQFLTHPMGPIPRTIRRRLARVVSKQPGIGSDIWCGEVEKGLDDAVKDLDPEPAKKKRDELKSEIDFWLGSERFNPQTGIDIELLRERVRRVSLWLGRVLAAQKDSDEASLYGSALGQSDELLQTLARLRESGVDYLPRVSVRRLIEAIRSTGSSRPGRPRQCIPNTQQLLRADSPAGFIETVSTVIWWGADNERLPASYPWSRIEQLALFEHGVELLPLDTQLEWQSTSWLRPILAASKRLVLVLHDNADSHHPIIDQIISVAQGWVEVRIDKAMSEPGVLQIPDNLPNTRSMAEQSLPSKNRWWRLPEGVKVPERNEESFSSLEKFLYAPHRWVLHYGARIRPGTLEALDDGPLLRGNLTHELFELFFNVHSDIATINSNEAEQWAKQQIITLIEQKGAVLLTPGRQAEKDDFVSTLTNALKVLIGHLQDADVVSVIMEMPCEGHFVGGRLRGSIDLVATKATGETAVIDFKWGGYKYRREMLVESNYLQLAVYAQLIQQNIGVWPTLGYFIVSEARMLVLETDFFPNATIEHPKNGESVLEFWQRAEKTWEWRRAQLDMGVIEVPVTGTEPDEASSPGEYGLAMQKTYDNFDDFTVLTGWSDKS
jgi:ATP-dependent helicase/nuclease subunit B